MEEVCLKLHIKAAEELRTEPCCLLNMISPKPNIFKEEARDLKELRQDLSMVITTGGKGVEMVMLDTLDYMNKAQDLPSTRGHLDNFDSRP